MNYAIILAGGAGSRFWPLSRQNAPKQFLNLCANKPMIEQTVKRIKPLIKKDNIYIATNKIYQKKIKSCLKRLDIYAHNLFLEPNAKNTLAPIALVSKNIFNKDKDAVIAVLPCDHYIKNQGKFLSALNKALTLANNGYIVTLGITPDRPETGYGYIKINPRAIVENTGAYKVEKFIEKPALLKAKKFVKDKNYFWNSGMFIFKADTILEEIKKFAPRDYCAIVKITDKKSLNKFWPRLTSTSIDYAIMQSSKKLALIRADFPWMDLGSWKALEYLSQKDKNGNIFQGRCIDIASKDTLVWSNNRILATIGLENIFIVNTKDAILVCAKDKAQEVKKIVQILKQKGLYKQV